MFQYEHDIAPFDQIGSIFCRGVIYSGNHTHRLMSGYVEANEQTTRLSQ